MTLWEGEDNKETFIFSGPKADVLRETEKLGQNACWR